MGIRKIVDWLNLRGIPHRNGRWFVATVHHVLAETGYVGRYEWNKRCKGQLVPVDQRTRLPTGMRATKGEVIRLPAHDIEVLVVGQLADWVEADRAATDTSDADALNALRLQQAELAHALREGNQIAQRTILLGLGVTVAVGDTQVDITISGTNNFVPATTIAVPATRVDRGSNLRMAIAGDGGAIDASPDLILLKLIVLAFAAREAALTGKPEPLVDHYSRQHQTRLARLSYLAPDLVGAIINGRQPPALNGRRLLRIADLPLDWAAQRQLLGFA